MAPPRPYLSYCIRTRLGIAHLISFVCLLALAGCRTAPPTGTIATKILEPYNTPPPVHAKELHVSQSTDLYEEATAVQPLALPVLPKEWARQVTTPVQIVVRANIDETGRVIGCESSLRDFAPDTPLMNECKSAIRATVMQWRFKPAVIAHVEPSADGKPIVTSERNVDTTLEVAFTLTSSEGLRFGIHGK